jgi:excisionase family DNA binding protein
MGISSQQVSEPERTAGMAVPPRRLLLSVTEAAFVLGVGRTRMYELLAAGLVESVHIGRLHKIPAGALEDFVERCRAFGELPGRAS